MDKHEHNTKIVKIFTDGACKGNPGPGGWGAVLQYGSTEKHLKGYEENTTNNRMELTAAIKAIEAIKFPCVLHITTDSQYVKNGIQVWVANWKKNGWKNSAKQPVKNQDLWQALDAACSTHNIEWHWVKGHSGHPENEKADALANQAIEQGH